MPKEVKGYRVRYPFGSEAGGTGSSTTHPAMSKEVARRYIKDEARRLEESPEDFSLLPVVGAVFVRLLNGEVVNNREK